MNILQNFLIWLFQILRFWISDLQIFKCKWLVYIVSYFPIKNNLLLLWHIMSYDMKLAIRLISKGSSSMIHVIEMIEWSLPLSVGLYSQLWIGLVVVINMIDMILLVFLFVMTWWDTVRVSNWVQMMLFGCISWIVWWSVGSVMTAVILKRRRVIVITGRTMRFLDETIIQILSYQSIKNLLSIKIRCNSFANLAGKGIDRKVNFYMRM